MAPNPPMPRPVTADSAPPVSIIALLPRRIHSNASPSECPLDEHALVLQ